MKEFFISYNKADRDWAEWIAWQLEEAGHTTMLQAWDFRPGGNFVQYMQEATTETARTIAVLSPDYFEALYTNPEWYAAFSQDPTGEKHTLLPVRVRAVELKGLFVSMIVIDILDLSETAARKALLEGIVSKRVKPPSAPALPAGARHTAQKPATYPGEQISTGLTAPQSIEVLKRQDSYQNMESLVAYLLPAHLQERFEHDGLTAFTKDDEAGLALIAELIDKQAENAICVIGRGPQLVDPQTSHYVGTVASAILREVKYKRILLLDSNLPQNGLLWLLLIERFLKSAKWRDSVDLYVVRTDSSNLVPQFQIIDDRYLHQVTRSYSKGEAGASRKAHSQFTMSRGEISQHREIYETHLSQAGSRYGHARVVELLSEILHHLDAKQQHITYHSGLVLDVIGFLEQLNVQDMPPRGIKFVGSLMPFTFTYQAAESFIKRVGESDRPMNERLVVLPFGRLGEAIEQFIKGRLDYVCVPIENSQIENLKPPTVSESLFDSLQKSSHKIDEVELPVKFVLSGVFQKPAKWRQLVAVEAAYLQIRDSLPKKAGNVPRYEDEVESNYHAAWLAQNDPTLIAVTTLEAARHLSLWTYEELYTPSGKNDTKFAVYSHSPL